MRPIQAGAVALNPAESAILAARLALSGTQSGHLNAELG